MRNIFHSLFGQLSNICSQIFSLKCQIKDQMWGRSDGNHVVRIFKYQIEECEGHHVENIKYKIEEPPHHVVRVLLLKPDEGWACGGGLCKKIEPNKKIHKIKTLPVLPTYQHRTFPSSSKVHHWWTPQSRPNPDIFRYVECGSWQRGWLWQCYKR